MAKVKQKVNLDTISQSHGALPPQKTIAQILGVDSGYEEATIAEYEAKIDAMTESDLHEHAVIVGVVPHSNTSVLKDKLINQYLSAQSRFVSRTNPQTMSKKYQDAVKAFMKGAI